MIDEYSKVQGMCDTEIDNNGACTKVAGIDPGKVWESWIKR